MNLLTKKRIYFLSICDYPVFLRAFSAVLLVFCFSITAQSQSFVSIGDAVPKLEEAKTTLVEDMVGIPTNGIQFQDLTMKLTAVRLIDAQISEHLSGQSTSNNFSVNLAVRRALANEDHKPIDGTSYDFANESFAKSATYRLNEYLLDLLLEQ